MKSRNQRSRNRSRKNRKTRRGAGVFGWGSKTFKDNLKDCRRWHERNDPGGEVNCINKATYIRYPGVLNITGQPREVESGTITDIPSMSERYRM